MDVDEELMENQARILTENPLKNRLSAYLGIIILIIKDTKNWCYLRGYQRSRGELGRGRI